MNIDPAADHLHRLGWSTAAIRVMDLQLGLLWVAEASKGDNLIRVREWLFLDAWGEAAEMADKVKADLDHPPF